MSDQQLIPVADAVIVKQENITTIAQMGPESYQKNALSYQRCIQAGEELLNEVKCGGMSDDLDRRLASYIEKARKTVKAMNERRAPVTKLFDQVRAEFTTLENRVDPAKKDTIPYLLAQYRNAYAAQKREEEERRRQTELAAQELTKAKESYRVAVEDDYRRSFDNTVTDSINQLTTLNSGVTLENYTATVDTVTGFQTVLPSDWRPQSAARQPYNLSADEATAIRNEAIQKLLPKFREQFVFEVDEYRKEILARLPSKRVELERIAQADAAEAARIKAEVARREAEEAVRKECERREAEEAARKKAEIDKANAEMVGLFDMNKTNETYTPKTKVSKKIKVYEQSGFLGILSTWWQYEGSKLSIEELAKIFKRQLSFCEKLATKDNILVESAAIEYYDDVKAQ